MLTINKPAQYGYRSVHDLPTPPSTSRPSPTLSFQDSGQKPPFAIPRSNSPSNQPMSAPHRGLPPPAAMTLAQPPPPVSGPPQPSANQSLGQAPPPPPPSQSLGSQNSGLGQFPAAPSWQHVTEESMRTWLMAKAEEEKRKQEEEKTRQESYRLEQRRMEHDILRTSLQGGIPPPMVPVVFAGMGGGVLSQAALEWAQQHMYPQSQQSHAPALMPPGPISPEHHRRDSQAPAYAPYQASTGVPSTPGSAQGPPSGYMSAYPPSPTRPRGQSMPGHMAGGRPPPAAGSHLPSLNTNVPGGGPGGGPGMAAHPGIAQSQREEPQPSPSIYFHHWQPPTSQAGGRGGADQPATPSGESPRKRKATGPQPAAPPPSSSQRLRSPPFSHSTGLSNPPPGRRRGHSRQRSDLGGYRAAGAGRGRGESLGPQREASPMPSRATGPGPSRDSGEASSSQPHHQHQHHQQSQQQAPSRSGAQSVSSLLSDNPPSPQATQYASGAGPSSDMRSQPGEGERRSAGATPHRSSEGKTRGGAAGSAATRERDDD